MQSYLHGKSPIDELNDSLKAFEKEIKPINGLNNAINNEQKRINDDFVKSTRNAEQTNDFER